MSDWLRDRREMAHEIEDLKAGVKALIALFDMLPPGTCKPRDKHEEKILAEARKKVEIFDCPCRGWKI